MANPFTPSFCSVVNAAMVLRSVASLSPAEVAAAYARIQGCRATYTGGGWVRVSVIGAMAPGGCSTSRRIGDLRGFVLTRYPGGIIKASDGFVVDASFYEARFQAKK